MNSTNNERYSKVLDNIKKFGNRNSSYIPFNKAIFYPLYSQEFIRTGFLKISPTLSARDHFDTKHILELDNDRYRIRKLTPKECWRIMGFTDEEFSKAEKVNSNTQLYKQAGNSIVVNVLTEIFRNILEPPKTIKKTLV